MKRYVEPKLVQAGWDDDPHSFTEQQSLTDGRIIVLGEKARRKSRKRADYLLRFARDIEAISFTPPTMQEQQRIVCHLISLQSKLDALKRHQSETAAALDALLPAVLERAFRGEL